MKASTHTVKAEEFGGKASYTFITGDSECVVHNASGEADARLHPLYPNARGDCYACSIAITAPGQVKCAAHGTGYLDTVPFAGRGSGDGVGNQ